MAWFSRKDEQILSYDEPQTTYPEMDRPEDFDGNTLCRACSNGEGDGICGYHHHKAEKMVRRAEHIYGVRSK